jgi:hypothetical protein
MSFDEYLQAQDDNLRQVRRLPEFVVLFPLLDRLYQRAFEVFVPANKQQLYFARLMLVCHRALFSATATICRAQPDDAGGVTRRAVEAARTALAVKHDPENFQRWAAADERMERWNARMEGRKAEHLTISMRHPKGHPTVDWLATQLGVLSDTDVHLTPEFLLSRTWETKDAEAGKMLLKLQYFEPKRRELEDSLNVLAGTHGIILNAFDECFDGAFSKDAEWSETRGRFARQGQVLAARRKAARESPGVTPDNEAASQ